MSEGYIPLRLHFPNGDFEIQLAAAKAQVETPEHEIFLRRVEENYANEGLAMMMTKVHALRLKQLASGAIK